MNCGAVTGREKTEFVLEVNRINLFVIHLTDRIQVTNEKYCTKRPYRDNMFEWLTWLILFSIVKINRFS